MQKEIEFILSTASLYLAKKPTRADVLSVFAGIRPLVKAGGGGNTGGAGGAASGGSESGGHGSGGTSGEGGSIGTGGAGGAGGRSSVPCPAMSFSSLYG